MKKLLQIRKYIIGFIVAIISIFAINSNVSAEELPVYNLDYNIITEHINNNEQFAKDYNAVMNYIDTIKDDYNVIFDCVINYSSFYQTFRHIFRLYAFDKATSIEIPMTLSSSDSEYLNFKTNDGFVHRLIYKNYSFTGSQDINVFISDFQNLLSNNTLSTNFVIDYEQKITYDSNNNIILGTYFNLPLYSNVDITYKVDTFNLNINGNLITNGDKFLTYNDVNPIESEELDFLTILKMFVDFNIENIGNTLNIITSRELLLIPFGVLLLISVIKIFKVVF